MYLLFFEIWILLKDFLEKRISHFWYRMFKKLLKIIGTQPGEEKMVTLLLSHGFFMGIFIATYQLSAETLFTGVPEFKERLDEAFLTQGFLGVITTFLFAYFQNRIKFSTLILFIYVSIFLYLVGIILYFKIYSSLYMIYLLFVMMGPLTALVLLSFWGIFGRLFDLRQSKRIIGGIDTGQLTGTIMAFIVVSLLSKLNVIDDSSNLIFVSAVSVLGAIIFLLEISKLYDLNIVKKKSKEEVAETKFRKILKDRYVILLAVFVTVSVIVYKFVDYSFLQVTPMQFPDEQLRLTFLSVFNGGIMILSFLIQTFVNDRIIMNYGLKVSLLVLPTILMVFTFAAIITGSIFGYTLGAESKFIYFFLCISLSKLFATSVRDALENPAFKLFFLSLDLKVRFDIQAKVEGVINQFGNIVAGAILVILGVGYFTYIQLIHYSFLLVFILIGMIYVVYKLYNQYRSSLKQKLENQKESIDSMIEGNENITKLLELQTDHGDPFTAIFSLKVLEIIEPVSFESRLVSSLGHRSDMVREYVLRKIEKNKSIQAVDKISDLIRNESSEEIKQLASKVSRQMQKSDKLKLTQFQFFILIKSENPVDREFAARFLTKYNSEDYRHFMAELLSDVDPNVRGTALISASRLGNRVFWPNLIDNLSLSPYSGAAFAALVNIGTPVLDVLENAFYKTDQEISTLVQIVKIYGRIGGEKAIKYLWKKIDYPNKDVGSQVLRSLGTGNFLAQGPEVIKLKSYINKYISFIAWNMAAIRELPGGTNWNLLKDSLKEENEFNYDHLYLLLSLIYEKQSIQLVRENINSGTVDGVTFAIELLDVFVSEDIKNVLVPVLDDISTEEAIRRLQEHFPRESYSPQRLLIQIINRDYNFINLWTKTCAIYNLGLMDEAKVSDDLIANLFNRDSLIREMAAWAIYQIDPAAYEQHTQRIPEKIKKELDEVIIPHNTGTIFIRSTKFHRVQFLRKVKIFSHLPAMILYNIAMQMMEVKILKGGLIYDYGNVKDSTLYILVRGKAESHADGEVTTRFSESALIGDLLKYENNVGMSKIIAVSDCILYTINRETLYDLIPTKHRTFRHVLPEIKNSLRKKMKAGSAALTDII